MAISRETFRSCEKLFRIFVQYKSIHTSQRLQPEVVTSKFSNLHLNETLISSAYLPNQKFQNSVSKRLEHLQKPEKPEVLQENVKPRDFKPVDFSKETAMLISAIKSTGINHGMTFVVRFVNGSKDKSLLNFTHLSGYGLGSTRTQVWWKLLAKLLISNGYLELRRFAPGFPRPVLTVARKGESWFQTFERNSRTVLMLKPNEDLIKAGRRNKLKL